MMKLLLITLFAGLALANIEGAWKQNTEYEYRVHGRTLAALHDVADQYTGILIRANLRIQRKADDRLVARIVNPEQAHIHINLPEGWYSHIPENQLHYKPLALNDKPFEIVLSNGVVREIIVDKEVSEWETNLIKSFVSQIQVDVKGHNMHESQMNQKIENGEFSANFRVMEPTVTGNCLTTYNIMPAGEHLLQHNPEFVPLRELTGGEKITRIVKNKDYSKCKQKVENHFALDIIDEAAYGKSDEYLSRTSTGILYLSGDLMTDYVIQSSRTVNIIVVSPTMANAQKGMVVSAMNVTLINVKQAEQAPESVQSPISAGNLIYSDVTPMEMLARRENQKNFNQFEIDSEERRESQTLRRFTRSIHSNNLHSEESSSEERESRREFEWENAGTQPQYKLNEAQGIPLLQKFAQELKSDLKPVETTLKLVREIAVAMQDSNKLAKENTLSRFSDLIYVVRLMNAQEIEQVYEQLWQSYQQDRENKLAIQQWRVIRDAIAQSGTGPALLAIKKLIKDKKVENEEAAEIVAVLPNSIQFPTQEYIRSFYELATSDYVKEQSMINDTAILSFTELIRLVYVDHHNAKKRYSMHYFQNTETETSKTDFVKKELVPYLSQKLQLAIENDDSHKAQVFIRALGNVADKSVFAVFKPYLEGERSMSEFQRVLMIMSMDQLTQVHPKTTRTILYKIIMNNGESSQVRVAAVYQLIRCNPSKSMLQALALLTTNEPSLHVRAAIKSSIESASELKGYENQELAQNAKASIKLLTKEEFGVQHSYNYLSNYMVKNMPLKYEHSMHKIHTEDSMYPNHLHYNLHLIEGDVSRKFISVATMVSSVKSLIQVVGEQFPEFPSRAEGQMEREWADKIAKLLNIKMDEDKKLEANLRMNILGSERFLTLDNRTIERLPELFPALLNVLQSGKRFSFSKFYIDDEVLISFPTEMSFVFMYSLRRPSLVSVEGKVHLPGKLGAEAKFDGEFDIKHATTTQSRIGFITPHEHKLYTAGYTKNWVLSLPLAIQVALENNGVKVMIAPMKPEQSENILHMSAWPYTYQDKIVSETQGKLLEKAHVIHRNDDESFETVFGKDNGIAFKWSLTKERNTFLDWHTLQYKAEKYGPLFPVLSFVREEQLSHCLMNIKYIPEESTSRAVNVDIAWKTERSETETAENEEINLESLYAIPVEKQEERKREFLKKVSTGLKTPSASVYDIAIKFEGKQQPKYVATLAVATNSNDDKYNNLWFLYRAPSQEERKFQMYGSSTTKDTKSTKLNFVEALRADCRSKTNVKVCFGEEKDNFAEINMKIKLEKTEERRQALQRSEMSRLCRQQMQNNKFQYPACANLTVLAQMMDRVYIETQFKNIDVTTKNMTSKLLTFARHLGYDYLEQNDVNAEGSGNENMIKIYAQVEPERYEAVNVTIETPKTKSFFKNIRTTKWIRPLLMVRPEVAYLDAIQAKAVRRVEANSICVLEQDSAVTFNNRSYPVALGHCYHALLNINLEKKVEQHNYRYTVLARDSVKSSTLKDLKIVYNIMGVYQVIDLLAISEHEYEIKINKQTVNIKTNEAYIIKDQTNFPWARIQYFNNELKLDFDLTQGKSMDDVTLIYNGARVKVMIDDKFRGDVRGLCGSFSEESWYDFMTPRNTMIRDASLFAASYALVDETCEGPAKEKHQLAANAKTVRRETIFTRVITENDFQGHHSHERRGHCHTKHQTRYTVENNGKTICFSTRPMPVCSSGCRSDKTVEKTVGVHCLQRTNTVNLYKQQIDKGASPDFSSKPVTKTIKIRVPQTCN